MGVEILLFEKHKHWEVLTMGKWGISKCWNQVIAVGMEQPEAEGRRQPEVELSGWEHMECRRTKMTKGFKDKAGQIV